MDKKLSCILLVDDDFATNELHTMVIEVAGAAETVQVATNGQEALDYLSKAARGELPRPDLILLDINMPCMDGFAFMERYQHLPAEEKGEIVVLMLTTSLSDSDRQTADGYADIRDYLQNHSQWSCLRRSLKPIFKNARKRGHYCPRLLHSLAGRS